MDTDIFHGISPPSSWTVTRITWICDVTRREPGNRLGRHCYVVGVGNAHKQCYCLALFGPTKIQRLHGIYIFKGL